MNLYLICYVIGAVIMFFYSVYHNSEDLSMRCTNGDYGTLLLLSLFAAVLAVFWPAIILLAVFGAFVAITAKFAERVKQQSGARRR